MLIFYNAGSILLGLLAWALPTTCIVTRRDRRGFPATSFLLCSLSLMMQLMELRHRAFVGDFSGIDDTVGAVTFAGLVLVMITVVLNLAAYVIAGPKK